MKVLIAVISSTFLLATPAAAIGALGSLGGIDSSAFQVGVPATGLEALRGAPGLANAIPRRSGPPPDETACRAYFRSFRVRNTLSPSQQRTQRTACVARGEAW